MSLHASGTKSRILSCRYFCLSCGSPGGSITSGSCSGQGFQSCWFFVRRVSVFSSASHRICTSTLPGVPEEKIRWWNDVMPSKAPLLKYGWKCSGVEGSGFGVEGLDLVLRGLKPRRQSLRDPGGHIS